MMLTPTLDVQDLTVAYRQRSEWLEAVRDFSLRIQIGETYGLVGESGSGKTTLAMSILGYLPENGRVLQGAVRFEGRDLLKLNSAQMRRVWGTELGLVPQNPQSSLNPSLTIGEQLVEGLRQIEGLNRQAVLRRGEQLLRMVKIADPERVLGQYPHQISGGMQQRVLIAMAVAPAPKLLVLDEPTTNLDATTQASILDLFRDLITGMQTSALYVTHNLGVVAQLCDRVAVMYAGELVEDAPLKDLYRQPLHPYTQALINSVPRLGENKKQVELQAIEGLPPALGPRTESCVFINRCPLAIDICRRRPPLYRAGGSERRTRCHRWMELASGTAITVQGLRRPAASFDTSFDFAQDAKTSALREVEAPSTFETAPVLKIQDVSVTFEPPATLGALFVRGERLPVRAVNHIDLQVGRGRTLGVVGESGSGKSTLARTIAGLVERTGGDIQLMGVSLPAGLNGRDLDTLRSLQMVFQNPEEAFNPYLTLGEILRRPFLHLMKLKPAQAELEMRKLMAAVRLPAEYAEKLPGQLSGGERQRAAIARAIATRPALVLADEPVSALDVSVQASILNLLNEIQVEQGNTLLFISHDLAVVSYLADEIAVTYLGFLMECSSADDLFQPPYHPYTEALLAAIPSIDPDTSRSEDHPEIRLKGEIPSPTRIPTGCPFHTRCPRFLGEICVEETPPWRVDPATGKRYFCHIPVGALQAIQAPLV